MRMNSLICSRTFAVIVIGFFRNETVLMGVFNTDAVKSGNCKAYIFFFLSNLWPILMTTSGECCSTELLWCSRNIRYKKKQGNFLLSSMSIEFDLNFLSWTDPLKQSRTLCFLPDPPRVEPPAWASFPASSSSSWIVRSRSRSPRPRTGHTQWAAPARKTPFCLVGCVLWTSAERRWSRQESRLEICGVCYLKILCHFAHYY